MEARRVEGTKERIREWKGGEWMNEWMDGINGLKDKWMVEWMGWRREWSNKKINHCEIQSLRNLWDTVQFFNSPIFRSWMLLRPSPSWLRYIILDPIFYRFKQRKVDLHYKNTVKPCIRTLYLPRKSGYSTIKLLESLFMDITCYICYLLGDCFQLERHPVLFELQTCHKTC